MKPNAATTNHPTMNDRHSTRTIRRKKGIFYRLPLESDQHPDPYMDMFMQDVSLGVMPIGGRSCRPDFKVTVSHADSRVEQIVVAGLSQRRSRYSLASSLYDFFRLVAAKLCAADSATSEIVYFEEPETKKVTGFELSFINNEQLIERRGRLYQFIPREIAEERNVPELILLPTEDLIIFQPPANFRQALRDLRTTFSRLSSLQFSMLPSEAMKKNIPYDFNAHDRSMKLALVEAVKPIGWNARGMFNDQVLSYYWIRLMLTFESFKVLLRDAMLSALNEGLQRIGQKMGLAAELEIRGLPTLGEVDDAIQKLNSGTMAFTEVMKPFNIHRH